MRVLHVINSMKSGGAEKLVADIIIQLNNNNIEVDLLLLSNKDNVYEEIINNSDIKIHTLSQANIRNPLKIYQICKFLTNNKYDIIHAHLFPTIYWVGITQYLFPQIKSKFLLTEHSTYNKRRKYRIFKVIEKNIYKRYDRIISISNGTRENLLKWLDLPLINKYVVINNGIEINKYANSSKLDNIDLKRFEMDYKFTICMIGRFVESKDHATLIRAMMNLPELIGLVLIGNGPLENSIKKMVIDNGLENRVRFLGYQEEIEKIIKSVDIVVHSAHWEGFGLAVLESMAAGKPVVASDVSGLNEIVNGAGILFNPSDDIALSNIINQLYIDKSYYNITAINCTKKSLNYGMNKTVDRYIALYKDIIKE